MGEKWEKIAEVMEYEAEVIKNALQEQSIPVLVRPVDFAIPAIFGSGGMVEILVPKDAVENAKEILSELKEG